MPHVVHAAAQRHPLRLLAEHVLVEPCEHLVGFVAADASRHGLCLDAVCLEAGNDEADVTRGISPAARGNRVAEEGNLVAAFHGDLRGGPVFHNVQQRYDDRGAVGGEDGEEE